MPLFAHIFLSTINWFVPMTAWPRAVVLLLCGLLLLTVSIAVLNTLVPLWLAHDNFTTSQIGGVGSAFFSGNLLGTLIAGSLIRRWGFNRGYYFAAFIFAMATLALLASHSFSSWLFWRFIAGIGCALIWVVVESALMCQGTIRTRGRLLAAYMMVYYLGTVGGQLVVSGMPDALAILIIPFLLVLMLLAILPVLLVKITHADPHEMAASRPKLSRMLFHRGARHGIHGCILSGVVLGALYGLLPLYFAHMQMDNAQVGYWMALLVAAGIMGQWPAGRLADRYGRLAVLRVQVSLVIIGALAMLLHAPLLPALFILGSAGFSLYPVAMSWACEKVSADELVTMAQSLLLSYTTGSLIGPALTSWLMQSINDNMLFFVIGVVAGVYLVFLLRSTNQQPSIPVAHA